MEGASGGIVAVPGRWVGTGCCVVVRVFGDLVVFLPVAFSLSLHFLEAGGMVVIQTAPFPLGISCPA